MNRRESLKKLSLAGLTAPLLLRELAGKPFNPRSFVTENPIGWNFNPGSLAKKDFMVSLQIVAERFLENNPEEVVDGILANLPLNNLMVFPHNRIRRSEAGRGGSVYQHPQTMIEDGEDVLDKLRPILEERDLSLTIGIGESVWGYQPWYAPYSKIAQRDVYGRILRESCVRNPAWNKTLFGFPLGQVFLGVVLVGTLWGHLHLRRRTASAPD